MPWPPAQEQKQCVEKHCVSDAGDPPAATLPTDSHVAGNHPHEKIVDHSSGFPGPVLHQAPGQRWLRAQVTEEEAATQDGHPNRDPETDTSEPGCHGKTQAGKSNIRGRIDLTPGMAGCSGLTCQPTIQDIRDGDTPIQQ